MIVPRPPDRLASLQVLRGVAALSVVLFHVPWIHIGSFGVDVFFVLSGFIIAHVTARNARRFAAKRLIRILPLYWGATLAIFAAARVLPGLFAGTEPTIANLARSLAFVPYARSDGAVQPLLFLGWTLIYEMLFYALFALALTAGRKRAPAVAIMLLIVLAIVGVVVPERFTAAYFWTRPIILEFALGIAVWVWRPVLPGIALPMAVALGALALLILNPLHLPGNLPVAGLWGAALLVAMLSLDGRVAWPRAAILIGDASFSLYLLHPYVIGLVARGHAMSPGGAGLAVSVVAAGLSIVLAILSFRTVELPSQRALRHWLARSK